MTNLITNLNGNFSVGFQDVVTVVTIALIGLGANQVMHHGQTSRSKSLITAAQLKAQLKQCLPASLIQIQDIVITAEMIYGQGVLRLTNLDRAYGMLHNIFQTHFPDQPWFLEALPHQQSNNDYPEDGIPVLLRFPLLTDADQNLEDHLSDGLDTNFDIDSEDAAINSSAVTNPTESASSEFSPLHRRADALRDFLREDLSKNLNDKFLHHKLIDSILPLVLPWLCLGLTLFLAYTSYTWQYGNTHPAISPWLYCGGIGAIIAMRELTLWCLCRWHQIHTLPRSWALPCFGSTGWLGHLSVLPVVRSPSVLWQLAVYPNLISSGLALTLWLCSGDTSSIPVDIADITLPEMPSLHQAWQWQHWSAFPSWGIYLCHKLQIQLQSYFQSYFQNYFQNYSGSTVPIPAPLAQVGITGLLINAVQMLPLKHTEGRYLLQTILGTHRTRQLLPSIKLLFLGLAVTAQPLLLLPLIATLTISSPLLPTTEDLRDLSFAQEILTFLLWIVVLLFILPMPKALA